MTEDEAKAALDSIERKRDFVLAVLKETRLKLETHVAALKENPAPKTGDIIKLQSLTLQGSLWVRVLDRLKAEAADVATALDPETLNKNKRAAAPVIDPSDYTVPNTLPDNI